MADFVAGGSDKMQCDNRAPHHPHAWSTYDMYGNHHHVCDGLDVMGARGAAERRRIATPFLDSLSPEDRERIRSTTPDLAADYMRHVVSTVAQARERAAEPPLTAQSPYTPTTRTILDAYVSIAADVLGIAGAGKGFARWLRGVQEEAFRAAWEATGDGYNGECPDEGVPWKQSAGHEAFERWEQA